MNSNQLRAAAGHITATCNGRTIDDKGWVATKNSGDLFAFLTNDFIAFTGDRNAIIVRLCKQKGLPTPLDGFYLEPDLGQYVTEVKVILDGLVE